MRCAQTADGLGVSAAPAERWADLFVDAWAGRTLEELAHEHPAGLRAWMTDPAARPHGGESVAELVARVDDAMSEVAGAGLHLVVTSPMVLRAAVVAVIGGDPSSFWSIDAGPLDGLEVSVNGTRRTVRRLRPFPQWVESRH